MRLDRLLTLYLFGPLSRLRRLPPGSVRIPILMYHSISDTPETGHPYYWINTKPALFAEHMRFLYENDCQVIPLTTAVELIRTGNSEPQVLNSKSEILNEEQPTNQPNKPRYVVLTFDDGYLDFYTEAFPILRQYGYPATIFLPTDYIDGSKPGLREKKHLAWEQVRELSQSGIDFGSHTCSHPQLYDLKPNEIELELRKSKETIEQILNSNQPLTQSPSNPINQLPTSPINQSTRFPLTVASFCYPYKFPEGDGPFVKSIEGMLRGSGYTSCATTRIGTGNNKEDLYSLKRIPVNSADDEMFFLSKLTGEYNWVYPFQVLRKNLLTPKKQVASEPKFLINNPPITH